MPDWVDAYVRHVEIRSPSGGVGSHADRKNCWVDALVGANLATNDDLRNEITGLRQEMELLRRDLTIKISGMMVVSTGVLLAAIRYLPPDP
jgi:hypothetical protein